MILVTGASGFLGHHVVRRLLGSGEAVRCVCRPGSPGADRLQAKAVEVAWAHLHDPDGVERAFRGIRQVIHLAAPVCEVRDVVVEQFHQRATCCLVEAARRAGVDRFLTVSPMGCGTSADLPFLRSRGAAEEHLRSSGIPFVILQSSLMFGSGDRLIGGIIRLLRGAGLLVIPGTGKTMLQPVWVGDVASCILRALRDDKLADRVIPIGGPQHLTYEEVADQVAKMLNLPRVKIRLSLRTLGWVSRLLEGLGRNPFLGYRHLELLSVGTITALDAVKRSFDFQPMPLVEGVAYQLIPRHDAGLSAPPSRVERSSRTRGRR